MKEVLVYIIYGIVQGITEFLPVSSSGHLVIVQDLFNIEPQGIILEIVLHLATLIAVIVFLRKHLLDIIKKMFTSEEGSYGWMYFTGIILATIPAGIVGFLFQDDIEGTFENILVVGISLIFTGIIVFLIPYLYRDKSRELSWKNILFIALIVGVFQAIAILPGISRSGSTIFAGVLLGLSWRDSANFSFTISIPAILGSGVLGLMELLSGKVSYSAFPLISGFIAALITGLFALWILYGVLKRGLVRYFGIYCFVIGIAVVIYRIFLNG